ncbi:gamma-glutamyl-phosphate reductase, partial [Xanthomonas oryzae pv. oryzae]
MTIKTLALQCRDAAQVVSQLSSQAKCALLQAMAAALEADAGTILAANAR